LFEVSILDQQLLVGLFESIDFLICFVGLRAECVQF